MIKIWADTAWNDYCKLFDLHQYKLIKIVHELIRRIDLFIVLTNQDYLQHNVEHIIIRTNKLNPPKKLQSRTDVCYNIKKEEE